MKKKTFLKYEYSYQCGKILSCTKGVSDLAVINLKELLELVRKSESTASKNYFYDKIDEWSDPLYDFISKTLKKFGFKNGNREYNDRFPDIVFWWEIYGLISSTIYSPNLQTKTENHHSSAYERNCVLEIELQYVLDSFEVAA